MDLTVLSAFFFAMMRALPTLEKTLMQPILNIALKAARQSSEYINQLLDKQEPAQSDAHASEKLLDHLESTLFQNFFDHIKKSHPTHFLVEPGETLSEVKEDSWHIQSIHNPAHLLRKLPSCAFSVVHKHQGKTQNALLVNPFSDDEFTASRGAGAALNGRRIRCSSTKNLNTALIATNAWNQFSDHPTPHIIGDFMAELANSSYETTISGCDALDIAMVASGQIEAAVLTRLDHLSLDAPLLLCQEAGVLAGTFNGSQFGKGEDKLVVANPKLFKALVQRLNGYQGKL